jgi:hypothetical protein
MEDNEFKNELERERLQIEAQCRICFVILNLEDAIEEFWEKKEVKEIFSTYYSQVKEDLEKLCSEVLKYEFLSSLRENLKEYYNSEEGYETFIEDVKFNRIVSLNNAICRITEISGEISAKTEFICNIREQFETASESELNQLQECCQKIKNMMLNEHIKQIKNMLNS